MWSRVFMLKGAHLADLVSFSHLLPEDLLFRSGAVFNTGERAFTGHRAVYMLGLNPGGDPQTHQHETVRSHTEGVLKKALGWCAYRDESWNGRPAGTTGMQPRIQHLFQRLGLEIGDVPMSNLIFERTRSEADLKDRFTQLAEVCWPVHEAVVSELGVRTILCLGGKCGEWVRERANAREHVGTFEERNDRRWKSHAYRNRDGLTVVTLTHPAIASWVHEATDPTPLVRQVLAA